MLTQSIWSRLSHQLDSVATILAGALPEAIMTAGPGLGWSALDHLDHLVAMHELLLERLRRVLLEDLPQFELEPGECAQGEAPAGEFATRDVLTRLQALRGELLAIVRTLTADQLRQRGCHPTLGVLDVRGWLGSFCLHEAYHLHVAWERVAEATCLLSRPAPGRPA